MVRGGASLARRLVVMSVSLAVLGTVTAPGADAALCIQWRSPTGGDVGSTVPVIFETYAPLTTGAAVPFAAADYPFRITARSPDGELRRIEVSPTTEAATRWTGELLLDNAGVWEVYSENFGGDSPCGPRLRIGAGGVSAAPPLTLRLADPEHPAPDRTTARPRPSTSAGLVGVLAVVAVVSALLGVHRSSRHRQPQPRTMLTK